MSKNYSRIKLVPMILEKTANGKMQTKIMVKRKQSPEPD